MLNSDEKLGINDGTVPREQLPAMTKDGFLAIAE